MAIQMENVHGKTSHKDTTPSITSYTSTPSIHHISFNSFTKHVFIVNLFVLVYFSKLIQIK
jgi:hypothetical protein